MGDPHNDSSIAGEEPAAASEPRREPVPPQTTGFLPRLRLSPLSKTIWAVSVPIVFVGIGEQLVDLTDTAMLARYGIVELGAVGLADTIFEVLIVLILGLVDGMQIVIARRVGQGDDRAVGEIFNQALGLLVLIALAVIGVIVLAAPSFCETVFESAHVAAAVSDFLFFASLGLPFHAACLAYSALLVSLSRTRGLIGATLVLAATNLALDYGLIFGRFGLPELGIRGAAIGSAGAELATCVFLTVYTWRRIDLRRYGLFRRWTLSGRITHLLAGLSWPIALQALLESVRWFLFFVIIERLGERPLALANIIYVTYAVLMIPAGAFGETACSMVSNLVGGGRESGLSRLLRNATLQGFLITLPALALVLGLPRLVLLIFSGDAALIEGAVDGMRVIALALVVAIPGEIWFSAVVGTGDTLAAFLVELLMGAAMLGFAFGAAVTQLPLALVWVSLPIGWIICLVASYAWVRSARWKRLQI